MERVGPCCMCITRQRDELRIGGGGRRIKAFACGRETVPGIEVPGQAKLAEINKLGDIAICLGGDLLWRQGFAEIRRFHLGHDDLIGQHLPGLAASG